MESVTMCRHKTVRGRLSKKKFCGERQLGSYDAPLDQTGRPSRKVAAWPASMIETRSQPAGNLGPSGVDSRFERRRKVSFWLPSWLLHPAKLTHQNCSLTEEHAGVASRQRRPRGIEGMLVKKANTKITLLKIQPFSVVTVGGTAVT
jgi:hypothetical protein